MTAFPNLPQETLFPALAALGALLLAVGLWAAWRLATAGRRPSGPARPPVPPEAAAPRPDGGNVKATQPRPAAPAPLAAPGSAAPGERVPSPFRLGPDEAADRERLVYLVARHDKVIQSPIAGVYITLGKCFEDLGFQAVRARTLADLQILLQGGVPGVMAVDCRLGPRVLREVARLAKRHPGLRDTVYFFYNAERPETLHAPSALPHAHFLGLGIASQQVMEILAPAFEFAPADGAEAEGRDSGAVFEGVLSENSLPEILQFLEVGRRTGLLSLEDERPVGVVNFVDGEIASAQTHLHEGMEAVFEILALARGRFRFFPGKAGSRGGPRLRATEVLLHWAQRVDETGEMVARRDEDPKLPF